MIYSARPSPLTATACASSLYQTTRSPFPLSETCRKLQTIRGCPGYQQPHSWTGYRCTGRGFSNSATDHRRRGHNPRQALYPYTRERHRNGQRGRQKTGAVLRVRVYPPGDRISSAAHRPTLQGDRETMREIQPPPCIILYRQQVDRGATQKIYIPRPAVSANCRNYNELPGNYQQPAVSLSKYQQAPGRGTISAGSAAGDRRAAARKFSRNSNGKTPTGGGPGLYRNDPLPALRRNTPEQQTDCRGSIPKNQTLKRGHPAGITGAGGFLFIGI